MVGIFIYEFDKGRGFMREVKLCFEFVVGIFGYERLINWYFVVIYMNLF